MVYFVKNFWDVALEQALTPLLVDSTDYRFSSISRLRVK